MKKIEAIIDPEIFPEVSTRRRACWLICWMMSGRSSADSPSRIPAARSGSSCSRIAPRRRIVG